MPSTLTGAEVKRARESIGASQTEIAAASGLNRTYYSLFEAGRYVLDADEETRLCELFSARGVRVALAPRDPSHGRDDVNSRGGLTVSVPTSPTGERLASPAAPWLEGWNLWDWWPTPTRKD
jgi:transcriptional regulator with XRE-family HTH domain